MIPVLKRNIHAKVLAEDVAKRLDEIKLLIPSKSEGHIRKKLNDMKSEISEIISSIDNHIQLLIVDLDVQLSKEFTGQIELDDKLKRTELKRG